MDKNMRPLSLSSHSSFFSSLKQVEKRLKLEQRTTTTTTSESQTQERNSLSKRGSLTLTSTSSCSPSPMFIHLDQPSGSHNNYAAAAQDSSEAPLAFLSIPHGFTPTSPSDQLGTFNKAQDDQEAAVDDDDDDDIERLMQFLGLSEEQGEHRGGLDDEDGDCSSCHCEGGFYSKIVGVEGPKCRKEVQRLDGWIKLFLNGGGEEKLKLEPLRLAHLLLGKAAFISEGADGGFGGLEFPSTIQEFLHNDPPSN